MLAARPERPAPVRVVASATAAMTVGILPVFMLGATATDMRADLDLGRSALGIAIGAFFAAVSFSSAVGGRLAERIGPRDGLRLSSATGALVVTLVAAATSSFVHLLMLMVLAGLACGLAVPGAGLALVRGVQARPGLMFGLQQSAPPAAAVLAGAAVPLVAVALGWRWAWALGCTLAVLVFTLMPPATAFSVPQRAAMGRGATSASGLRILAVGAAFGSAAALSLGAFFMTSAVDRGVDESTAGVFLAVAGAAGISARLVAGVLADRRDDRHLQVVAVMMLVGAGAFFALGIAHTAPLVLLAGIGAYGFGYGWSGLLFFAVAAARPEEPALAIGIVNAGATAGAAVGPAAFGLVASAMSLRAAWTVSALAALLGGALVMASARRLTTSCSSEC